MELDDSLYWVALAVTPGLASRLTAKLLKMFGTPEAVFRATLTELEEEIGLSPPQLGRNRASEAFEGDL